MRGYDRHRAREEPTSLGALTLELIDLRFGPLGRPLVDAAFRRGSELCEPALVEPAPLRHRAPLVRPGTGGRPPRWHEHYANVPGHRLREPGDRLIAVATSGVRTGDRHAGGSGAGAAASRSSAAGLLRGGRPVLGWPPPRRTTRSRASRAYQCRLRHTSDVSCYRCGTNATRTPDLRPSFSRFHQHLHPAA